MFTVKSEQCRRSLDGLIGDALKLFLVPR